MADKDYYGVLGVDRSVSGEDIKKAFRAKAHQVHPDKPGGDEAKFKELNEAYQVLSNEEKRRQYDQFGSAAFDPSTGSGQAGFGGGFSGFSGAGFEDLGDLFGGMFGGNRGGRRRAPRGHDIYVDTDLTFAESVHGKDVDVSVSRTGACARCRASGAEPGSEKENCKACGGSGARVQAVRTMFGTMQSRTVCETCDGEGSISKTPCTTCKGLGVERARKTLTVSIPAGVEHGSVLRVRGEGEAVKNGSAGDLLLRLHVASDPRFERDGDMIFSRVRIGFSQAALGDTVDADTVDGTVELKIPTGTQSGTEFRLRGKGIAGGDQIVVVTIETPKKLSKEQKRLLEELDLRE